MQCRWLMKAYLTQGVSTRESQPKPPPQAGALVVASDSEKEVALIYIIANHGNS